MHAGPFDLYASEGQVSTGWTVGGMGWYRKTFDKPQVPPGGKAELRFEGVYMNCDVWLNGAHLGNHPYGYTEFAFDATPHLKDGKNTVAVRVNNTGRNSRWYSGSGIFRKVWLGVDRPCAHSRRTACTSRTPEVGKDAALVNVEVTVESSAASATRATARVRLLDASGATAGEAQAPVTVPAGGSATATCAVHLANPRLWSPDDPHLYRAEVLIEADRKVADATSLHIGVRKIEIDAAQGLRINGESIKLRGGCVHHDNGPLGSACIPRAEERRVEILKANGYNAIRTSHNPPSRDFLDACDRLGMVVIDEAFDCWESGNKNPQDYHLYFKDWWQRDLESMILRDRNHPSVILWSIGNEINERAEPHGVEIGKALAALAHKLDPTRKVTAAICHAWDHPGQTWQDMQPAFTYLDVGGYNYQWAEYEKDHAKYPDRIMAGTESFPNQAFQNWSAVEKNSWVIGDFIWTAIDYLGESGIGHASIRNGPGADVFSAVSVVQLLLRRHRPHWKQEAAIVLPRRSVAAQQGGDGRAAAASRGVDRVHQQVGMERRAAQLDVAGLRGQIDQVRVYTRGDRVKLLLNGKEVGLKRTHREGRAQGGVFRALQPGELKAVAYRTERRSGP